MESYRSLETVLGEYNFGAPYVVYAGKENSHSRYTAVHESTHAMLGYSTSFGIFQSFIAYLSHSGPPKLSLIARGMLSTSLEQVRDVHEAAATFAEFMAARKDNYDGLPDMEKRLPDEYRDWRAIFDDLFQPSLSDLERWYLADQIARCAMDTNILADYSELSPEKVDEFKVYFRDPLRCPNQRLKIMKAQIKAADQEIVFANFITELRRSESELIEAYKTRSYETRKLSLSIHIRLRAAFEVDARSIDIASSAVSIPHQFTTLAGAMVDGWKVYAKAILDETFEYRFVNTDGEDVDRLFENEVIHFDLKPQPYLSILGSLSELDSPLAYVASAIEWLDREPFLLSTRPHRELNKGDFYIRLIPIRDDLPAHFMLSSTRDLVQQILKARLGATLLRGRNFRLMRAEVDSWKGSSMLIVYWVSWSELIAEVDINGDVELLVIPMPDDFVAFVLRLSTLEYHMIIGLGAGASLIYEEIIRRSHGPTKMLPDAQALQIFRTILTNASYILGA